MTKRKRDSDLATLPRRNQNTLVITFNVAGSNALRPVNDLTRISNTAGFLQYADYRSLLIRLGHVRRVPAGYHTQFPATPQRCNLQVHTRDRTDDCTDFRADQSFWTQDDLPEILYSLNTPANWISKENLEVPPMKQYLIRNKILRDIPILPDHISSNVEGWRFAAWCRMDPRIKLSDIVDRIESTKKISSTVQMRTLRFRNDFPALGWVSQGGRFAEQKRNIQNQVEANGIDLTLNTTRGTSWGLIDPSRGEAGGRISVPSDKRWDCTVEASPSFLTVLPSSFPPVPLKNMAVLSNLTKAVLGSREELSVTTYQPKPTSLRSDSSGEDPNRTPTPKHKASSSKSSSSSRNTILQPSQEHGHTREAPELCQQPVTYQQLVQMQPPDNHGHRELLDHRRHHSNQAGNFQFIRQQNWQLGNQDTLPGSRQASYGVLQVDGLVYQLRDGEQRRNFSQSLAGQHFLTTFFPRRTAERRFQMEYLLDPLRAQFGFTDLNGDWGVVSSGWYVFEGNIAYNVTAHEAMRRLQILPTQLAEGFTELMNSQFGHDLGDWERYSGM